MTALQQDPRQEGRRGWGDSATNHIETRTPSERPTGFHAPIELASFVLPTLIDHMATDNTYI